jgi:hypothetical protein
MFLYDVRNNTVRNGVVRLAHPKLLNGFPLNLVLGAYIKILKLIHFGSYRHYKICLHSLVLN